MNPIKIQGKLLLVVIALFLSVTTINPLQAKALLPETVTQEKLDKITSLAVNMGMWSYAVVFGGAGNFVCEAGRKGATDDLNELGIKKLSKSLSCGQSKQWKDANIVIEDIGNAVSKKMDKNCGDYFRIKCYSLSAQFYLTGLEKIKDPLVVLAYIIASQVAVKDAVSAAERVGVPSDVSRDGSAIADEVTGLMKQIPKSGDAQIESKDLLTKFMEWEKVAMEAATDIILKSK